MSTELALVIGDGVAGCLAAIALRERFSRVIMAGDGGVRPPGDFLMTVTPRWNEHLHALGLGQAWDAWSGKHRVSTQLSGWGSQALVLGSKSLIPSPPRHLVSRVELATFLRQRATAGGIELMGRHHSLPCGADVTVDASGRSAHLARRAGARWRSHDALLAHQFTVARSEMLPNSTVVMSADDGWWFAANAAGRTSVMLMSSDRKPSTGLASLPAALSSLVKGRLEGTTWLASMSWLEPCSGEGWFAVGDAALAVDPICGAGLETAAATARLLGEALDVDKGAPERFNQGMLELIGSQRVARHRLYARASEGHRGNDFWARHSTAV